MISRQTKGILVPMLLCAIGYIHVACNKSNSTGETPDPVANAEITILANEEKQVIRGFGCATVFNPPNTSALTSQEFDRLFGSGNGQVGLSLLRIRVAPEDDPWRTTELNHAKEAMRRGAAVIASPWSPPARMKTNNSSIGGSLKTDSSEAYARYLNDFANYMASNGASIYAVSIQNEPDIQVGYESCDWTAGEMQTFLKNYGQLITATRVIAPESFNNNQTYVNTLLTDDAAAANIDIVGGHIYGGGIVENALAKNKAKEVWMTEHLDTLTSFTSTINTATEIHNCLTVANFNAYLWWYGKRFYGPIGQEGQVTKRGYAMSQFSRFIKPGAVRVGTSTNTRSDVLISAYMNAGKLVIVAINRSALTVNQKLTISDAAVTSVMPYTTTGTKNAEQGGIIAVSGNNFSYQLPAGSISTFVQQ